MLYESLISRNKYGEMLFMMNPAVCGVESRDFWWEERG